jgi:hypothetical protein
VLTRRFGLEGAAVPWFALNLFAFPFLGVALNRRFHEGRVGAWYLRCSLPPLVIALPVMAAARGLSDAIGLRPALACLVAAAFSAASLGACLAARSKLLITSSRG